MLSIDESFNLNQSSFLIDGIRVVLTRKPVKNINLKISKQTGQVNISANKYVSYEEIKKFVLDHKSWINKNLSHQKDLIQDETVSKILNLSDKEKKDLKNKLLKIARPYVLKWEIETELFPKSVKARYMKSRWGVCNSKTKIITLNSILALLDKKYLDYVVLHEIIHLKVSNHGRDFYNLMDLYMPNWKQIRKELNKKYGVL